MILRALGQPVTRGDCESVPRPCRFTDCRYSMVGIESCALDVADRGEHTLKEVGQMLGLTHQRVQQIEEVAMRKVRLKRLMLKADGS